MAFRCDLETVVLGALDGEPAHGYSIGKKITKGSNGTIKLGEGQLYPTLKKLEDAGMVSGEWHPQEGKPWRRIYVITESGRKELEVRRTIWSQFRTNINSVLNVV